MRRYPALNLRLAKSMRSAATPWEERLWYYLRVGRFCGVKFKRQVPIGRFIIDFYSADRKLAIELDGSGHADATIQQRDKSKEQFLASIGIITVRIWNNELISNMPGVLRYLQTVVNDKSTPP